MGLNVLGMVTQHALKKLRGHMKFPPIQPLKSAVKKLCIGHVGFQRGEWRGFEQRFLQPLKFLPGQFTNVFVGRILLCRPAERDGPSERARRPAECPTPAARIWPD